MSIITNEKEIASLKEGGRRLARILRLVSEKVAPGVRTDELNLFVEKLIKENGDTPSLLGYHPSFAKRAYPSSVCVSVNDEVVHGIPSENPVILKDGDIVSFDLVITHNGLVTDSAITIPVGNIDERARKLISATRGALDAGIAQCVVGKHIGDIGYAIETHAEKTGFSVVDVLCGHSIGRQIHEDPQVPNFGDKGKGEELVSGLVLALEPMLNEGSKEVKLDSDGYTYRTRDGKRSAQHHRVL